jgi:hydrogenase nickel incorporation protein HypA/HybF
MHEMTIVAGVLRIAHRQAAAAGATRINRVVLEVGRLAGVEVEALRFCFAAAREGLSADAELVIREMPGRGTCPACGRVAEVDEPAAVCPTCGSVLEISGGRELSVASLNVD